MASRLQIRVAQNKPMGRGLYCIDRDARPKETNGHRMQAQLHIQIDHQIQALRCAVQPLHEHYHPCCADQQSVKIVGCILTLTRQCLMNRRRCGAKYIYIYIYIYIYFPHGVPLGSCDICIV